MDLETSRPESTPEKDVRRHRGPISLTGADYFDTPPPTSPAVPTRPKAPKRLSYSVYEEGLSRLPPRDKQEGNPEVGQDPSCDVPSSSSPISISQGNNTKSEAEATPDRQERPISFIRVYNQRVPHLRRKTEAMPAPTLTTFAQLCQLRRSINVFPHVCSDGVVFRSSDLMEFPNTLHDGFYETCDGTRLRIFGGDMVFADIPEGA